LEKDAIYLQELFFRSSPNASKKVGRNSTINRMMIQRVNKDIIQFKRSMIIYLGVKSNGQYTSISSG
jgi:hypothetical protein